ncbi:MAG: ABC-F family ATP-binding cassette domain-containing protein [Lachnospiraceae bacterium]|nr:ABC-F family ATP-binding cassette domain-containing protein [Lachnospiraceae bacterium]
MNLLTIENMSKQYTERMLFDNVSFSVNEGDKIGIIGINGTGKTTLLRIIAGLEQPDAGSVVVGNGLSIRYLSQSPVFEPGETVLEAVVRGNASPGEEWSVESDAKTVLNKLGITDFDEKVEVLSGGQRKRVALASTVLSKADILIMDEPTNHLDSEMSAWLEDYLKRFNGALVLVTHDRYFLDSVTNCIVEIDKGSLYRYQENYSGFLELKAQREEMALASERKRQSILRKEIAWIMRGARARSTKQKAHIQRYEELRDRKGPEFDQSVELKSAASRLGRTTVEIDNISKSYGDKLLFKNFTYYFLKNDRIGIVGHNGCGKSTLLKIINGLVEPDTGSVTIGQTVKLGYFSQENEYLDNDLRVIDYIRETAEYIRTDDGLVSASAMLEKFLFPPQVQYTKIEKLSGGEKRRLYLLNVLMSAPNVLILDEPTNDLDIKTLTILEDYLDSFAGIVISVSHDRYFLDRTCTRIFAFEDGGIIKQYEGGYTDYELKKRDSISEREPAKKDKKSSEQANKQEYVRTHSKKLKFTFAEQRDYDTIEAEIAGLEEKLADLELEIEKAASDYGRLNQLLGEKTETETLLEEKMERWMYLEELAARISENN